MPFKSKAQRRKLYAKDPELAEEFESETPKDADLPERVTESGKYNHPRKKTDKKSRRGAMERYMQKSQPGFVLSIGFGGEKQ